MNNFQEPVKKIDYESYEYFQGFQKELHFYPLRLQVLSFSYLEIPSDLCIPKKNPFHTQNCKELLFIFEHTLSIEPNSAVYCRSVYKSSVRTCFVLVGLFSSFCIALSHSSTPFEI